MKKYFAAIGFCFSCLISFSQLNWINVDSLFQPLPSSVHVYKTTDSLDGKPNIAFYVSADLSSKRIDFITDTSSNRRLTPGQFYQKNNRPLVVVNCTFFSFETNRNLNVVIKDDKLISYNNHSIPGRGKDTFTYRHPFASAIGISKKRKADVAWTYTDSSKKNVYAIEFPSAPLKDSNKNYNYQSALNNSTIVNGHSRSSLSFLNKWKMKTAVGGGPVLLQYGEIKITNNEELKFGGKAINDKHPRTAMGYTGNGKLIILVIQGRFNGVAEGASLLQEAKILKDLGCIEALNLDGGGSSCMLVNGKETITPSDKPGQRAVPAVFMIVKKD